MLLISYPKTLRLTMSLQKGKRRKLRSDASSGPVAPLSSRFPSWLFPFALGAIVVGSGVYIAMATSDEEKVTEKIAATPYVNAAKTRVPTLGDLAGMSNEQLSDIDIALMNLRSAEGLPGAERLDIQQCRRQLD